VLRGAVDVARELGPGKVVVAILCDSGDRYLSKCFNDDWMKDMGYLGVDERLGTVRDVLQFKDGRVEFATPDETLANVAHRMNELGISQMPVAPSNGGAQLMIHEADLLQSLVNGECTPDDTVERAAKPLEGQVGLDDPLTKVQRVFDENNIAVVVESGSVTGIISKIDVVEFLATRR
jgi:cystathionine beta-synthase